MYRIAVVGLYKGSFAVLNDFTNVTLSICISSLQVSVERVSAYTQVPSEPALHSKDNKDSDSSHHSKKSKSDSGSDAWPAEGEIVMENLSCSYRHDLPPIIKNLSLHIQGGERIGVVGRTGAGKSTLIR